MDNIIKAQVGQTKVGKDGKTYKFIEYKPGKFDWRTVKDGSDNEKPKGTVVAVSNDLDKMKNAILKLPDSKLIDIASKPNNNPQLREIAYALLQDRNVDVSEIDMNTGKLAKQNKMKAILSPAQEANLIASSGMKSSFISRENIPTDLKEGEIDKKNFTTLIWDDAQSIKDHFPKMETSKEERIKADFYINKMKTSAVDYVTPEVVISQMAASYYNWLEHDHPLLIVSGSAGVGKTFMFDKVAEFMGKSQFSPDTHMPGDGDYDYFVSEDVSSDTALLAVLKEHNGKVLIFDDADKVIRRAEMLGVMKQATDLSKTKRMIGKRTATGGVASFEFTGKICVLSNITRNELLKNQDSKAVASRANLVDINLTKYESLGLLKSFYQEMNFRGVPRLPNAADDIAERDEVFKLIEENIDIIDPMSFTTRMMAAIITQKRDADKAKEGASKNTTGAKIFGLAAMQDWKPKAIREVLAKAKEDESLSK